MAENIQNLIRKIQEEGVKAAEEKARQIEDKARSKAQAIMEQAKLEANKLIQEAKEKIAKEKENSKILLKQAARDMLLNLRKELNSMLDKIILLNLRQALSPEELSRIISSLIKEYGGQASGDIVVSLKKEDFERLEEHFFNKLREEVKKGILIKPSEDITGGFVISFDSGRSSFDFTDKALSEYIGVYLKPKLVELLKEVVVDNDKCQNSKHKINPILKDGPSYTF